MAEKQGSVISIEEYSRIQTERPEEVPSGDCLCRLQESLVGEGLCDHHHRDPQACKEPPPRKFQVINVLSSGNARTRDK